MLDGIKSLLPGLFVAACVGLLTYTVLLRFPKLDANLARAVAAGVGIAVLGLCYIIGQRIKRLQERFGRLWEGFWNKVKIVLVSPKARCESLRACLRGELERCRVELETEKRNLHEEKAKVDKTAAALVTLSQHVLGLCDASVDQADELDWNGAVAVSERADRCARGALCHHVTKVVYCDPTYPASWVRDGVAEQTRDFFVDRWFVEKDARQLRDWINQVLEKGRAGRSLVVFAQDIVPDTVVEVPNETCLLRRYLDAGGRVVWRGDIPFCYQGKSGGAKDVWGLEGPQRILGIDYTNYEFSYKSSKKSVGRIWDRDFPMQVTPAGSDIGLSYPRGHVRIRPVSGESVSVPYLLVQPDTITLGPAVNWDDDNLALCWKKNFNDRHRHGGFMQYITGEFLPNEVNDYFFRFAVSGWPLLFG